MPQEHHGLGQERLLEEEPRGRCLAELSQGLRSQVLELGDKFSSSTWTPGRLSNGTEVESRLDTGNSGRKLSPSSIHRMYNSKRVKDAGEKGSLFLAAWEEGCFLPTSTYGGWSGKIPEHRHLPSRTGLPPTGNGQSLGNLQGPLRRAVHFMESWKGLWLSLDLLAIV